MSLYDTVASLPSQAYRAELEEKCRAGVQVPSPDPPAEEELSVTTVDIPLTVADS